VFAIGHRHGIYEAVAELRRRRPGSSARPARA
jgi:hypothetical protein